MNTVGPSSAPHRPLRAPLYTAAAALLLTLGYVSQGAYMEESEAAATIRIEGGPPYFSCGHQKLKKENLVCDEDAGIYAIEMSPSGCDLFWRSPCFECCGYPAPNPSPPPSPSPPLLGNKCALHLTPCLSLARDFPTCRDGSRRNHTAHTRRYADTHTNIAHTTPRPLIR